MVTCFFDIEEILSLWTPAAIGCVSSTSKKSCNLARENRILTVPDHFLPRYRPGSHLHHRSGKVEQEEQELEGSMFTNETMWYAGVVSLAENMQLRVVKL